MSEIITVGETMAAFVPSQRGYLHYIKDYEMKIAGAESNLAVGISKLGHSVEWISALGEDEFGLAVQNAIRAEGVSTQHVVFDSVHSTGIMFKQMHAADTAVFYYRDNSAASHMGPEILCNIDWRDTKIFHITGITPVLSESCEELIWEGLRIAKEKHIKVSFDPNVRKKLWRDRDYSKMLAKIAALSDIVMLGVEEGELLFHTKDKQEIIRTIFAESQADYVALKDGSKGAIVATRSEQAVIEPYPCICVDAIGAGDAFNAGFLCGILEECSIEQSGRMGAIAGAMATENYGDIEGYPSRKQLDNRLAYSREVLR